MNPMTITDACGTARGYRAHRRRREAPCSRCLRANSETSIAHRVQTGAQDAVLVDVHAIGLLLEDASPSALRRACEAIGPRTARACRDRYLAAQNLVEVAELIDTEES